MSAWVYITWDDEEDGRAERHWPDHMELADVPREGDALIAGDGTAWIVARVEWRASGSVRLVVRPELP